MAASPYQDALGLLARRELSEAQVRQRLARRGHAADAIEDALQRLRDAGSVNDTRTAGMIARTDATLRKRGRARIRQRLASAGIAAPVAERALDELFSQVDEDALLAAALERRLPRAGPLDDRRAFARLYRHLRTQGFDHDRVMGALNRHRAAQSDPASDD